MKFIGTKKLLIASTSIGLIGGVALVSSILPKDDVVAEKDVNTVQKTMALKEKEGADDLPREEGVSKSDVEKIKDNEAEAKEKDGKEKNEKAVSQEVAKQDLKEASKDGGSSKKTEKVSPAAESTVQTKSSSELPAKKKAVVKEKANETTVANKPKKETTVPKAETKPEAKPAPEVISMKEKVYETTVSLNMRATSSVNGTLLASIPKGTKLKSSQKQNGWFKVTYTGKTGWVSGSYLQEPKKSSEKAPVVQTPTPAPKPTPKPAPKPEVKQNLMSRAQAEAHISKYTNNGFNLISESGRYSIIVEFPTSGSGKAQMSVDGVNYVSGYTIKPEDFGQEEYDYTKSHFAQMNSAIQAYANSQFGVGSKDANTLVAEIKQMTLYGNNGDVKKINLQGKTVRIAMEGVRTRISY